MRIWTALLFALISLGGSGCTLIGGGLSIALGRNYPSQRVEASHVWLASPNGRVDLVLWNGERVSGLVGGVTYASEDSYAVAFEKAEKGLPALEESVSVHLLGEHELRGAFRGFDGNLLLLEGARATDLQWVEELRGTTAMLSGDELRRRASRGELPSRSRLEIHPGSAFSGPTRSIPYERIAWVERSSGGHPEVVLPFVIGLAADIWVVSRLRWYAYPYAF